MNIYKALNERRSVRKYKTDPVPDEKLKRVLEAARVAPSWKNQQCWKFIVIRDNEQKKAVSACVPDSNPAKRAVTETAPVVVVLCADPQGSGNQDNKDFYMLDAGIAMQQLMLAAHAEGLGTCWVGWFEEEIARAACGVPADYRVVALTPLGTPEVLSSKRARKELEEIVFSEKWGNPFKQ
jgi:nitroreductase